MNKAFLIGFLLCFLSVPGFAATMPPVQMKVVDAQDDSPVAGAVVLFQASASEGTVTGHGGKLANLFVVETATDNAGELRLAAQEFSARPFLLNTNYNNPSMVVFKPGYALLILANSRRIIAELQDVSTWQYNNQTVKMKRITTDHETSHAIYWASVYADRTMGEKSICAWKKIPRFLSALDRSAVEWNLKRASLSDEALRRKTATSPVQRLLMNDSYFIEKGCGSPKAFFEPYLR
jgi:hypothetical protein